MSDAFEFYPCLIDGAPASIYLNMRFEDARIEGADTRYQIGIQMRDAGPHGAGTAEEADLLNAFEEEAIEQLAARGLVYAGRVRSQGMWEITFYGPAGHDDDVRGVTTEVNNREVAVHVYRDAEWQYYVELLLPDAERRQWIEDRRLAQVLREQGDNPATPRRVDHWAYFASTETRDAFVTDVVAKGFALEEALRASEGERPFGAQVYRTDITELDHIHDVVMTLVDAAEAHGGDYDGWETSIER
jgi:regulator of RNase E activity RraB